MARYLLNRQAAVKPALPVRRKKRAARRRNNVGRYANLGMELLEPRWVLSSPGDLDVTFSGDGLVVDDLGLVLDQEINSVAIQTDGKIVVAGTIAPVGSAFKDFLIARYNADGSLDTSFGAGGFTQINAGNGDLLNDVAIDSLGRIVAVGGASNGTNSGFSAVRLTASGQLDDSFSGDGVVVTILQNTSSLNINSIANAVAIQSDGKIVVGGTASNSASTTNSDFAVVRYNADGTLDTSFDTDGYVITDYFSSGGTGRVDEIRDIAIQSDNKIVAVGLATTATTQDFALARYNPDGSLDSTFDGDGKVNTNIAPMLATSHDTASSVLLEPDGQIVVGGFATVPSSNIDFVLARYNTNGSLDPALVPSLVFPSASGTVRINMGTVNDLGKGLIIQPAPDGKYVIGGDIGGAFATTVFGIARVLPTGQLDTTFSGDGMVTTDFPATDGHRLNDLAMGADGKIVAAGWVPSTGGNRDIVIARYESGLLIAEAGGPYMVSEPGGPLTLNGSGTGTGLMFEWDFDGSDFSTIEATGANPTFNSAGDGPAPHTVWLRVTDGTGFQAFDSAVIHVLNVAPTLTIAAVSVSIDEGQSATNGGTYGDVPADVVSLSASLGTVTDNLDGTWSWSYYGVDDLGTTSVTITATDDDGGVTVATFDLTVNNVAPTITVNNALVMIDEGQPANNGGTYGDVPADVVSLSASLGTVTDNLDGTWSWSYYGVDDLGTTSVTITASDDDGGVTFATFDLTVYNVAPTVAAINASVMIDEGQAATNGGTYGDVPADVVSLSASLGTVTDNLDGTWSWSYYGVDDLGTTNITITASDDDGGSTTTIFSFTVNNIAPTADAGGPYFTFDDTPITLSGSGFDVAGVADPLSFEWDLDNNGTFETAGPNAVFDPQALGFTGTQTRTVNLRVNDGDGGQAIATTTVEILGVGTALIGGVLHVVGSDANDIVLITRVNDDIKVVATFNSNNPVLINEAAITEIHVRVRGGHDIVATTPNVAKLMTIDGGNGNDLLTGGSGRNVVFGGAGHDILHGAAGDDVLLGGTGNDDMFGGHGNDVLVGGDGNDILTGGAGRDLLIGSQNEDLLVGGNDEDVLIGGYTIHDGNVAALDAIMAVWGSSASFNARVATLTGSGGLLQSGVAVFDDDDLDLIVGGAGRDLVFGDTNPWDGAIDLIALQPLQDVLVAVN